MKETRVGGRRPAAELLESIDLAALPPEVLRTLREVGPSLAAGYTLREIGKARGYTTDILSARVAELRAALLGQARQPVAGGRS